MGLELTVRRGAWRAHVDAVARSLPGLIPVVKGNGYGFGRALLGEVAAELVAHLDLGDAVAAGIAVGTVHEANDVPEGRTPMVLTPEMGPLPDTLPPNAILTVGSVAHVEHLDRHRWRGPLLVKLSSSMRRYGCEPDELRHLESAIRAVGSEVIGYAVHPALAGSDDDHVADVEAWVEHLDPGRPILVSHLTDVGYQSLRSRHPSHRFAIRSGTRLWHGDKSMLHLGATVNDVRPVRGGDRCGYQQVPAPADGHLVMVAAGSAHGIAPLADGRSPFHFDRKRLPLLEPPHMHTSMVVVAEDQPCPSPGQSVDVQRPLTQTLVDTVTWLP